MPSRSPLEKGIAPRTAPLPFLFPKGLQRPSDHLLDHHDRNEEPTLRKFGLDSRHKGRVGLGVVQVRRQMVRVEDEHGLLALARAPMLLDPPQHIVEERIFVERSGEPREGVRLLRRLRNCTRARPSRKGRRVVLRSSGLPEPLPGMGHTDGARQ
jgi:hypothetical protein